MRKDASLLPCLDVANENNICVADDFALDITGRGDITCQHCWILYMYHVPSLSANLFLIYQLT